jgi:glycosyltransferase involved in cell wall biosynthesis
MTTDETRPMRVAMVTPRYPPVSMGGGQKSAELLASNLTGFEQIEEVVVFSFDGNGEDERKGVTVRRLGSVSATVTELQNLSALAKLRGKLANFDVVHAYNMELHPLVGHLSTRAEVPSVATLNSYHFFRSSLTNTTPDTLERVYETVGYPTTGRILRHFMKQIDVFVALSRAIQSIYEQNGFGSCRFKHIPNMIDPAFEVPPVEEVKPTDGYELLYVGSLTENKGVIHLLRALEQLPADYQLRLVGEGPRQEVLRSAAAELDITERVEFSGWVPYEEIGAAYVRADLFVHPGIWPEPLNRTVFEAMQAGLPVVCTDIGGPPEVIQHDECLCEPADPNSLAAAVSRARSAGSDIGAQNRAYILEHHTPDAIVAQMIELYRELWCGKQR